jgi:hypothetical protein
MGSLNAWVNSYLTKGYHTESAATAITEEIQGKNGFRTVLIGIDYLCAATAHTMYIMWPGSLAGCRNTCDGAHLAAQKVIDVNTSPTDPEGNAVAASDIVAYQLPSGVWEYNTVASLATKEITHTNNLAAAVADDAKYMVFGVVANGACANIGLAASTNKNLDGFIIQAPFVGDPLYLSVTNATHAGFLNYATFAYINK